MHLIDRRKTALDQVEHDVQLKRLTAAASYREWSSKQTIVDSSLVLAATKASGSYQLGPTGAVFSSSDYSNHHHHPRHSPEDKYGSEVGQQLAHDDNRYKIINYAHSGMDSRAIPKSNEHTPPPPPSLPPSTAWLDALQSKLRGSTAREEGWGGRRGMEGSGVGESSVKNAYEEKIKVVERNQSEPERKCKFSSKLSQEKQPIQV
jgi:hypothetical protein